MKKSPTTNKANSELDQRQKITVFMLVVVLAGFLGWAWEFLFAEIKDGFRHPFVTGGNLLPWINIYAYGAILILITCTKLKKHTIGNGTRYWDYTESWIGTGNINGFVCPASAVAFGLGAMALVYCLLPQCISLAKRVPKKTLFIVAAILFSIVIIDEVVNLTLKNLGQPTAQDFYTSKGWVRLVPQHKE